MSARGAKSRRVERAVVLPAAARLPDDVWAGLVLQFLTPEAIARTWARTSRHGLLVARRAFGLVRKWHVPQRRHRGPFVLPPADTCRAFRLQHVEFQCAYPLMELACIRSSFDAIVQASAARLETLRLNGVTVFVADVVPWPSLPNLQTLQIARFRVPLVAEAWWSDWLGRCVPNLVDLECAGFRSDDVPETEAYTIADGVVSALARLGRLRRLHLGSARMNPERLIDVHRKAPSTVVEVHLWPHGNAAPLEGGVRSLLTRTALARLHVHWVTADGAGGWVDWRRAQSVHIAINDAIRLGWLDWIPRVPALYLSNQDYMVERATPDEIRQLGTTLARNPPRRICLPAALARRLPASAFQGVVHLHLRQDEFAWFPVDAVHMDAAWLRSLATVEVLVLDVHAQREAVDDPWAVLLKPGWCPPSVRHVCLSRHPWAVRRRDIVRAVAAAYPTLVDENELKPDRPYLADRTPCRVGLLACVCNDERQRR